MKFQDKLSVCPAKPSSLGVGEGGKLKFQWGWKSKSTEKARKKSLSTRWGYKKETVVTTTSANNARDKNISITLHQWQSYRVLNEHAKVLKCSKECLHNSKVVRVSRVVASFKLEQSYRKSFKEFWGISLRDRDQVSKSPKRSLASLLELWRVWNGRGRY